jgi:glucosyl-dolichyl phosphate glucuronosyltransferase
MRSWGDAAGFPQVKHIPYGFSGSNITFPKALLADYGGFSAQFGMTGTQVKVGEESDLCHRIWSREGGWPNRIFWYSPAIKVQHLTTRKNTQISYRLRRVRASGLANAAIEPWSWSLLGRTLLELLRDAAALPFRTLFGRQHRITNFVIAAQKVSYRAGFLTGLLRKGRFLKTSSR